MYFTVSLQIIELVLFSVSVLLHLIKWNDNLLIILTNILLILIYIYDIYILYQFSLCADVLSFQCAYHWFSTDKYPRLCCYMKESM